MTDACSHPLVRITSRKMIKPSSPTPHHQTSLKLSLLDKFMPPTLYSSIILFYSSPSSDSASSVSESLQASLSKALVLFYPLAGLLKTDASVDCNDEGAHFLEARVNCRLSDLLKVPDHKLLNNLMANFDPETVECALGSVVLLVQLSLFNCGGVAVVASPMHKILDATGYYKFLQTWAAIHRGKTDDQLVLPEFTAASVLPPRELPVSYSFGSNPNQKLKTQRFVFDLTKLASLKAKTGGTHVELVSAIILRTALAAACSRSKPETAMFFQTVSFRSRLVPAVSQNVMGNWILSVHVVFKRNETELQTLVAKMRNAVTEFKEKAHRMKGDAGYRVLSESLRERGEVFKSTNGCVNLYRASSLCKLPMYEIDFGWGKPTWVTSQTNHNNLFILIDTKHRDGIEAWVTLEEEEMAIFESEEELLSFASVNPSAIINHHSHSRM